MALIFFNISLVVLGAIFISGGQFVGNSFVDTAQNFIDTLSNIIDDVNDIRKDTVASETYEEKPNSVITVQRKDERIDIIKKARANGTRIRCAGSKHSPAKSINPQQNAGVTIALVGDVFQSVYPISEDDGILTVRVGAGCYIGHNPMDPKSTVENGLAYQLDQLGYALSITGGITHQTIAGYMLTGADGGSLKHGTADSIGDIEFIDGTGTLNTAKKGTDLWQAVGVSMGLYGIVTSVVLHVGKRYLVQGLEENVHFENSFLAQNEKGVSMLRQNMEENEYFRIYWFPQKHVRRVQQWTARREHSEHMEKRPYNDPLKWEVRSRTATQALLAAQAILEDVKGKEKQEQERGYIAVGNLVKPYVSIQHVNFFRDDWYKALPNDNDKHVDRLFNIDMTEIWLPIDQSNMVIERMNRMFTVNQQAAGPFITEIYSGKESPFWLSGAYGGNVVKIDAMWYHYNIGDIEEYWKYFWDVLLDFPRARLHWGKWLPRPGQMFAGVTFNLNFLKKNYPKMDDWLALRKKYDPDQVFVTEYWREILEIPHVEKH